MLVPAGSVVGLLTPDSVALGADEPLSAPEPDAERALRVPEAEIAPKSEAPDVGITVRGAERVAPEKVDELE